MSFGFRDYYQQLGVTKTASQHEIRSAFRRLARQFHPDVATDKKAAEDKFKEINEAYEVLGDPERRRKFDAYRSRGWFQDAAGIHSVPVEEEDAPTPPSSAQAAQSNAGTNSSNASSVPPEETPTEDFEVGGTGFSDFFERLFGVRRPKAVPKAARRGFAAGWGRGQDIEADFLVKLEEVVQGATRRISFRRTKAGNTETYQVKIPRGVTDGQRIRLAGVGEKGRAGLAGDLYLRVKLQKHPDFRVDGYDLITDIEVPVYQLVLGKEVEVPTLEGKARMRIPPGSKDGQILRLPGLGLPDTNGQRGNLLVQIQSVAPRYISPNEQRLWETIAKMQQKKE